VIGWNGTPDSGATFKVVKNAREAEKWQRKSNIVSRRLQRPPTPHPKSVSVDTLFANIAATQQKTLKVITVRPTCFGSTEAVRNISKASSTKVSLEYVSTEVGIVPKNDVLMAEAAVL